MSSCDDDDHDDYHYDVQAEVFINLVVFKSRTRVICFDSVYTRHLRIHPSVFSLFFIFCSPEDEAFFPRNRIHVVRLKWRLFHAETAPALLLILGNYWTDYWFSLGVAWVLVAYLGWANVCVECHKAPTQHKCAVESSSRACGQRVIEFASKSSSINFVTTKMEKSKCQSVLCASHTRDCVRFYVYTIDNKQFTGNRKSADDHFFLRFYFRSTQIKRTK